MLDIALFYLNKGKKLRFIDIQQIVASFTQFLTKSSNEYDCISDDSPKKKF